MSMLILSAFEDSAVFNFSWLYSTSASHIPSFYEIHSRTELGYVSTGLLAML
jgi:hypothetical protein